MSQQPGQTFSRYRLVKKIGSGGMGEVWRAFDSSLEREVAIKFLHGDLVSDAAGRRRFIREARTAAAATHPNIATIHEIGEANDTLYIVMELVAGSTVRDLIKNGPLSVSEVLRVGVEVADGLSRAHQAGVVHRDLKPDNLVVGDDGHARILDFGLAKLLEEHDSPALSQYSKAETLTEDVTRAGAILGTLAYMSPEQAGGLPVDARSDVFSFGATLSEMLTGTRVFKGSTPAEVQAAVIRCEPRGVTDAGGVPDGLQQVVSRCLKREPKDRYPDAASLFKDLEQVRREWESQTSFPGEIRSRKRASRRWLTIGGVTILVGLVAMVWWLAGRGADNSSERKTPLSQRQITTNSFDAPIVEAAISPDGSLVAYTTHDSSLYLRDVEGGEVKDLQFPHGQVYAAVWYPDGRALLVTGGSDDRWSLWRLSLLSGETQRLRDDATGYSVSPDGSKIAFQPTGAGTGEIWVMDSDGENPRQIVAEKMYRIQAVWSPDSKRIAYRQLVDAGDWEIFVEVRDLESGELTTVVPSRRHIYPGIHFAWIPDGRIVFSRTESLERPRSANFWEVPIDEVGKPIGPIVRLTNWDGFWNLTPTVTRDGARLSFIKFRNELGIFVAELHEDGSSIVPRQMTSDNALGPPSGWTTDSESLLFSSDRRSTFDCYQIPAEGGKARAIIQGDGHEYGAVQSPDGTWLLYSAADEHPYSGPRESSSIMRVPVAGGAAQLVATFPGDVDFGCGLGPESQCVLSEIVEDRYIISRFDLERGKGTELVSLEIGEDVYPNVDVAPSGDRIVISRFDPSLPSTLQIISLDTGSSHQIRADPAFQLKWAVWAADGRSFYAASFSEIQNCLWHVSENGEARTLWCTSGGQTSLHRPFPSPDGRRLAFAVSRREAAAWMLEHF